MNKTIRGYVELFEYSQEERRILAHGWCADIISAVPLTVVAQQNGREIACCDVSVERQDVKNVYPAAFSHCGFVLSIPVIPDFDFGRLSVYALSDGVPVKLELTHNLQCFNEIYSDSLAFVRAEPHEEVITSCSLSILLTNRCMYDCSYCGGEGKLSPDVADMPLAVIEKIFRTMELSGKKVCFQITGGEPTLHKGFFEALELFSSLPESQICVATNLGMPLSFYHKMPSHIKSRCEFLASYHWEFAKYDDFCAKLELLLKGGSKSPAVHVQPLPGKVREAQEIRQKINLRFGDALALRPLTFLFDKYDRSIPDRRYSPEEIEFISEDIEVTREDRQCGKVVLSGWWGRNELLQRKRSYKGVLCAGGAGFYAINSTGEIYPGLCFLDLKSQPRFSFKTNSEEELLPLFMNDKYIVCPMEYCDMCGYRYPKRAKAPGEKAYTAEFWFDARTSL